MLKGCYTACITPLKRNFDINFDGLKNLVNFQVSQGVSGILAVGTTGESPVLTWEEHFQVIEKIYEHNQSLTIAGTGSNCTSECLRASEHAKDLGIEALLLVDPYYNGPSSLEIRREYISPIAANFPEVQVIPYVIPGRTGTQLLPQDLAILHNQYSNVDAVKEATGDLENMKLTRKLCGDRFTILSGDDDKTFTMMKDSAIRASGVISVISNVAPAAVQQLVTLLLNEKMDEASKLVAALKPLFQLVTVKTLEVTPYGEVTVKARNPLPIKTLMNICGMPAGAPRQPLGKMTMNGVQVMLEAVRKVYETSPQILEPIEEHFNVDLTQRLYNKKFWSRLTYD